MKIDRISYNNCNGGRIIAFRPGKGLGGKASAVPGRMKTDRNEHY